MLPIGGLGGGGEAHWQRSLGWWEEWGTDEAPVLLDPAAKMTLCVEAGAITRAHYADIPVG